MNTKLQKKIVKASDKFYMSLGATFMALLWSLWGVAATLITGMSFQVTLLLPGVLFVLLVLVSARCAWTLFQLEFESRKSIDEMLDDALAEEGEEEFPLY